MQRTFVIPDHVDGLPKDGIRLVEQLDHDCEVVVAVRNEVHWLTHARPCLVATSEEIININQSFERYGYELFNKLLIRKNENIALFRKKG